MMKFESYKQCIYLIAIVSISIVMGSCSSATDPYQPFVGDGEIEYSQKPADVIALSGKSRVVLKIVRPASPLVKKAGIFWNSGNDSLKADFPVDNDTLEVSVPGLNREGTYSFDIYTYNKNGEHRSVATTVSVSVYGEVYANSILTRELAYLDKKENNTIVHWQSNPEGSIGTMLKYINKFNESDSTLVPPDSSKIRIPLSEDADSLTYYSLYQPGASIDTFRAPTRKASVEGSSSFIIYDDKAHEGWTISASDGIEIDSMNTDPVFEGKYSTMVDYTNDDFGILFYNSPETIDLSNYSTVQISIYVRPSIESTIRVAIRNSTSSYGQYRIEVNTEEKNTWRTYNILIAEMGNPTELDQLIVQSDSDPGVAYVDDIKLY